MIDWDEEDRKSLGIMLAAHKERLAAQPHGIASTEQMKAFGEAVARFNEAERLRKHFLERRMREDLTWKDLQA